MTDDATLGVRTRILLTAGVIIAVIAPVVVRVSATRGHAGSELEGPWTRHIRALDQALAAQDTAGAVRAWFEAHAAAMRSPSWEGLLAVGQASLRVGERPHRAKAFEARARRAYLMSLFRARDRGSVDGVLRTAAAFAELGDREVVERCLAVAESLMAGSTDPQARERVRLAGTQLRERLLVADVRP